MSGTDQPLTTRRAREMLGVGAAASPGELRRAFRNRAKAVHPDRSGGDAEAFRRLVQAYDALRSAPASEIPIRQPPSVQARRTPDAPVLQVSPTLAVQGGVLEHVMADERRVRITVPAGLRHGDRLRVGRELLSVAIRGDGRLIVRGNDLWVTATLDRTLMDQGGRTRVETPLGPRDVWITQKAASRGLIRLEGEGLPARGRHRQGDMFIRLQAAGETASSAARTLLRRFAAAWAA
ncbi:DnaJ C-terminal domain-containing protein [Phenylobacterium sp.]|uniref:J domain-containing protein n=1 Tax=Phenylobacterium sp. TaxID=1871053 RepID=UPI00272FA57B|nr:DnaJ C-terminal domain-containing protein [Phenylobacterium sp.]MDP1617261.1 DnaJ domain-containing protein [Phenylobacterium sp.]MDP1987329.1 DnaJ domain-containing protein [Phenylobacterium sp.]